jgi:hypothetical protein
MTTGMRKTLCPVCGYDLGFRAWEDGSPSDEICPSCGIQFGYDDHGGGNPEKRQAIYAQWRRGWIESGTPWSSKGLQPPAGWDPATQLRRVETTS